MTWTEAKRRLEASAVIEEFPLIRDALANGRLAIDKAVEVTRFAVPEKQHELIEWARSVSLRTVREVANASEKPDIEDVRNNDRCRNFGWSYKDGGTRVAFYGGMPVEQGQVVINAIDRIARAEKPLPEDEHPFDELGDNLDVRRADALYALASQRVGRDFDPDRANIDVHVPLETLLGHRGCAELQNGSLLHPSVAQRLMCDARVRYVIENQMGQPIGLTSSTSTVPRKVRRVVLWRDKGCTFPGCGSRHGLDVHHVVFSFYGGETEPNNLTCLCKQHHKLVHEYGWKVHTRAGGGVRWFRPNGDVYGDRLPPPDPLARSSPPPGELVEYLDRERQLALV